MLGWKLVLLHSDWLVTTMEKRHLVLASELVLHRLLMAIGKDPAHLVSAFESGLSHQKLVMWMVQSRLVLLQFVLETLMVSTR